MAINYSQAQADPLLQSSSASSDYTPYINASRQAAGILSNAAYGAGNTAASNYGLAQSQIRQGNQSSANYNNPYTTLGLSATQRLQNLMTDPSSIKMDPSYQFNLDQQMQQLQNKNVAGGKLLSGQNIDDIARLTSGYAGNAYQQQIANNTTQAGLGQASAINQGNQDFNAGQAIGSYQGQIGDTQGNAQVAAANAQARGLYDAARGLVAQSTVKSNPFGAGGSVGGVTDLGTKDSSIKTGEKSFEDFQKELANQNNNARANGSSNQGGGGSPTSAPSGGGAGGGGSSSGLGGAPNGNPGGNSFGTGSNSGGGAGSVGTNSNQVAPGTTAPDYLLNGRQNTSGNHDLGGEGGPGDVTSFAGSTTYNPLSGGALTGLGNITPMTSGDDSGSAFNPALGGLSGTTDGSIDENAVRDYVSNNMNGTGQSGQDIADNLTGLGSTLGTKSGLPGLGGAANSPKMSPDGQSYQTGNGTYAKVGFNSKGIYMGPGYTGG